MKSCHFTLIKLLIIQYLSFICVSQDYDFFYFVQQWPATYCIRKGICCFPTTGKPAANFTIIALLPYYNNGTRPSKCNSADPYEEKKISDLIPKLQESWPTLECPSGNGTNFWSFAWVNYGTCSTSKFDQHSYFETSLSLKDKVNLLQILSGAGIKPDGGFYSLKSIKEAIKKGIGHSAAILCSKDKSTGNSLLYDVYLCVDKSGSEFIKCPVLLNKKCNYTVQFPKF